MPFPPPPTSAIDWKDVGFRAREVNGHIESHFSVHSGKWTDPQFVTDPYLKVHGLAPGLNYGQQAFEGIKAFRTPEDRIAIFRPSSNALRMLHSASFISIPQVPVDHFLKCVHMATALNAEYVPPHHTGAALYIRPLVFGSSPQLGLSPPEEYTFVVYVLPVGVYHGANAVDALILEDFDRAAPEGTGSAKVGGNYAPVMRWSEHAQNEGFGITLHLDSKTRTVVDEFSTSGFVGVREDRNHYTLVVPDSKNVIKSVTSESVYDIAKSLGWKVERRPITYDELPDFSEIMAVGTAAALVPIKSITMKSKNEKFTYGTGTNEPGLACATLSATLKGIQQGLIEDKFNWLEYIKEVKDLSSKALSNGVEDADGTSVSADQLT